jgi:hypothetical protein
MSPEFFGAFLYLPFIVFQINPDLVLYANEGSGAWLLFWYLANHWLQEYAEKGQD